MGVTVARVKRRRVVVESVIGFALAEELLGLRDAAATYSDSDNGDDEDDAQGRAAADAPVSRLARGLYSAASWSGAASSGSGGAAAAGAQRRGSRGDSCCRGEGGGHVVVSWCQQGAGGWQAALLAPAAADADAAADARGGADGGGGGRGALLVDVELICAPLATMAPDMAWARRLNAWNAQRVRLTQANAVLSTLGGGRFLCRQVGHAMVLARAQQAVAAKMGDDTLRGKCRVNEAYGMVWLGRYADAKAAIKRQKALAQLRGDQELLAFASTTLLLHARGLASVTVMTHLLLYRGAIAVLTALAQLRGDQELLAFASTALAYCVRAKRANRALHLRRGVPLGLVPEGEGAVRGSDAPMPDRLHDDYHRIRALDGGAAKVVDAVTDAPVEELAAVLAAP
ncbi:hypothetical protein JKP88DRAFT_326897 [Tribonema minus]|uniref:Uncharacterized protein n=1 Tax=Tribonema minus TaxID=303371 RepID=A0A835YTQ5_9STRA|nr:hypothetical protein JKP88DRAFT_326897 [Tribonema minus]